MFKRLGLGLVIFLIGFGATAFPAYAQNPNISQKVGVCDPKFGNNCIKPNADGSINVSGSTGGGSTPFLATGQTTLSATTSSSRVALPSAGTTVLVQNTGTTGAYVLLGNSSVVVTTSTGQYVGPGQAFVLSNPAGVNTNIAGITASGSDTLIISTGTGSVFISGGGGGGISGTTSNASSGVATSSTNVATVGYNYAWNGTTWDQMSGVNTVPTGQIGPYPGINTTGTFVPGTPITCATGNVAASAAICTLPGVSGKTTYITGFYCRGAGATVAAIVSPTLVGIITGTQTYEIAVIAGAVLDSGAFTRSFVPAVSASAQNTAIVLTVPSLGTGNTNYSCNAEGYQS